MKADSSRAGETGGAGCSGNANSQSRNLMSTNVLMELLKETKTNLELFEGEPNGQGLSNGQFKDDDLVR